MTDCEWGWHFAHEDLRANQGGIVAGTPSTDTDHGTAVLGEISGDINTLGITGITPDTVISASSFTTTPSAAAIRAAADRLGRGDTILLEIHRPGPGASGAGQDGFIAVEWWPDDYLGIRYAVERGTIVVEAASNLEHRERSNSRISLIGRELDRSRPLGESSRCPETSQRGDGGI